MTTAASGRPLDDVRVAAAVAGELTLADVSISRETLERQADVAAANANPQLAENLRRAAELTAIPDAELLGIYEALRPGRSTEGDLESLAEGLRRRGASRCADLVSEALSAYRKRGLFR